MIYIDFKTQPDDEAETLAQCDTNDLTYFRARITFFTKGLTTDNPKDDIDATACHEVLHVLLAPISHMLHARTSNCETDLIVDAEENLVCCLERALCGDGAYQLNKRTAESADTAAVV